MTKFKEIRKQIGIYDKYKKLVSDKELIWKSMMEVIHKVNEWNALSVLSGINGGGEQIYSYENKRLNEEYERVDREIKTMEEKYNMKEFLDEVQID